MAARDEARQRIYERANPSFWVKKGAPEDEKEQVLGVCKKELHYASLDNLEAKLSLFDPCMHEHGYQRATASKDR